MTLSEDGGGDDDGGDGWLAFPVCGGLAELGSG